jgi:phosphohistidine phosphatase
MTTRAATPPRTVTLIRHAHADNARHGQEDADRPLSARGQKEAAQAAAAFAAAGRIPDLLLVSPSRRTRATADELVRALGLDPHTVRVEERLYLAPVDVLLGVLQGAADSHRHLAVVGHNPGLSDFLRTLTGDPRITDLPPAAIRSLRCELRHWRQLRPGTCTKDP